MRISNVIIAVIPLALIGVLGWQAAHPPKAVTAASLFDQCYDETGDTLMSGYSETDPDIPQAWHRQVVKFLSARLGSPQNLPPDILALPDLPGLDGQPTLRMAMLHDRQSGAGKLFRAVQKQHDQTLDSLLSSGVKTREEVREILFMWLGVDGIDPESRGPFIDARELAFIEKLTGEKFYQIGRYPNPAAMAADGVKGIFRKIWFNSYARLMLQGPAGQLIAQNQATDFTHPMLDSAAIEKVAKVAKGIDAPADRLRYWQNIILVLMFASPAGLPQADMDLLDAAVKSSASDLDVRKVVVSLEPPPNQLFDRLGRRIRQQVTYGNRERYRMICYGFIK
jgi:hypothetical protein